MGGLSLPFSATQFLFTFEQNFCSKIDASDVTKGGGGASQDSVF
jgi:hypothetical protein